MGKKWGRNEEIRVGDIFSCYSFWNASWPEYYQVTALRGKTQVVLHAIRTEHPSQGVPRPLPGQLLPLEETIERYAFEIRGRSVLITQDEVTARVLPEREEGGRLRLRIACGHLLAPDVSFYQAFPADWEPREEQAVSPSEAAGEQTVTESAASNEPHCSGALQTI